MSEELNNLPNGWAVVPVQGLFDIVGGGTPSTTVPEYWQGNIPWITSADIDDRHKVTPRRFISEQGIENSATNLVSEGSVIVVTRVGLGKVGIAETRLCFSQDSQALILPNDLLNPTYVLFYMGTAVGVFKHISRGTTISGVTKKQLADLEFRLPPLREQQRIVAEIEKQLTRLEAAVEALKRVRANLKRYRASVLKAACEGRLVSTEAELARAEGRDYEPADKLLARILKERRARWDAEQLAKMHSTGTPPYDDKWEAKYKLPSTPVASNLPNLPEGWTWASLDQTANLITSGSRGWAAFYADEGALFIRAQDIKTDRLQLWAVARVQLPVRVEGARTLVQACDLLVTITGANVTRTAMVRGDIGEAYVSQHVGLVRLVIAALSEYMFYWIIAPSHGRRELERLAYGAGKPGLNLDNLRELLVAFPPLPEQRRIVAEVERRLSVIDELESVVEANLKRAERLRQAILKRAFEGGLVPQDPSDEPASVLLDRIRAAREVRNQAAAVPNKTKPSKHAKAVAASED